MERKEVHIFELTFCASLPLYVMAGKEIVGFGSGVIVEYKKRYFLCTAEHLIEQNKYSIGIQRGFPTEKGVEMLIFNDFSFLKYTKLDKLIPEDLNNAIKSFENKNAVDIAIREVELLDGLIQQQISIPLGKDIIEIPWGGKCIIPINSKYNLDKKSVFSLAGMINSQKPSLERISIEPRLIAGMKFSNITDFLIEFDLGRPIQNYSFFKGCSGAPIFDVSGNMIAIFIGGNEDVKKPFVYGFRFDIVKDYIEMIYFNTSLDKL